MAIPDTCAAGETFALRVTDDSMEPEFPCGCVIVVDPTGRVRDGAFVVAEIDGTPVFRRLALAPGGAMLEALNADYPPTPCAAGIGAVRGVVVQRAGTRRRDHRRYD